MLDEVDKYTVCGIKNFLFVVYTLQTARLQRHKVKIKHSGMYFLHTNTMDTQIKTKCK